MRQIVQLVRATRIQYGLLSFRGNPPQGCWPCVYEYSYAYDHEGD